MIIPVQLLQNWVFLSQNKNLPKQLPVTLQVIKLLNLNSVHCVLVFKHARFCPQFTRMLCPSHNKA